MRIIGPGLAVGTKAGEGSTHPFLTLSPRSEDKTIGERVAVKP